MTTGSDPTPPSKDIDLASVIKLHVAGDLAGAERGYRQLIASGANVPSVYANLGLICAGTGRPDEAIALLRQAIALKPDYAQAHYNLGNVYRDQGDLDNAFACYTRATDVNKNFAEAYSDLGVALKNQGKLDQAIVALKRAVAIKPEFFQAYSNLGNALQERGKINEAIAAFRRAIEIRPDFPSAYNNLGNALRAAHKFEEAFAALQRALQLDPQFAQAHCNMGSSLKDQGRFMEASAAFQRAIDLKPDFQEAYNNLIYCNSFAQTIPPEEQVKVARAFETCLPRTAFTPFKARPRQPGGKLRVGFLSAEIGNHAVSYFLETYLRHYDREKIHVTLYSTTYRPEAKRAEMFAMADQARDFHGVPDDAARAQIMADGIDVLAETTSHMRGNRLAMLAQRCAAVQCHYIGYHGCSGLSTIDYFIGDDEVTPPEFASQFSEKIWRLPRLWVAYTPPVDAPKPEQLSPPDRIVFGSFNNLAKVRDECLSIWAQTLKAVPKSTLVIKDRLSADSYTRNRIINTLAAKGVDASLVEFIEIVPSWADHMRLYNRIDIALDTLPVNSGTTGFDALFMGTPLVALRGNWMGGRMTSAMVKALGYEQWVAETPADYVRIISELAADKAALKAYKAMLREQVIASPLCDGPALARAVDTAFAWMMDEHRSKAS